MITNPFGALFERRSSGPIASSHDLWNLFSRGYSTIAGENVNENTALAIAAVSTCVRLYSEVISTLPADIIERVGKSRNSAEKHSAQKLLIAPNQWQTFNEWLAQAVAHYLLRGNSYSWIVPSSTNPREVSELLPLHPDQVEVEQRPHPYNDVIYKWTPRNGGQPQVFSSKQILHIKNLSTNGIVGRSILEDQRETFGVGIATQKHASTLWGRGGLPTVVLKHPKALSAKAKTGLETFFEKTYGGGVDQRRVAVIEEGMSIEQMSPKLIEQQFIETRRYTEGEIYGLYRVPRVLSGNTDGVTAWGTGIEQLFIGWKTVGIMPIVVNIEKRFTQSILGPGNYSLKLFVNALMRGDSASRGVFYRIMREVGAYSANDIRRFEDENPIDGGDTYLQPLNLAPLGFDPTKKAFAKALAKSLGIAVKDIE